MRRTQCRQQRRVSRRSKGTVAAETARASQGLLCHGVDDTGSRRRWGKMEDGAEEVDGAKSDIDIITFHLSSTGITQ